MISLRSCNRKIAMSVKNGHKAHGNKNNDKSNHLKWIKQEIWPDRFNLITWLKVINKNY